MKSMLNVSTQNRLKNFLLKDGTFVCKRKCNLKAQTSILAKQAESEGTWLQLFLDSQRANFRSQK